MQYEHDNNIFKCPIERSQNIKSILCTKTFQYTGTRPNGEEESIDNSYIRILIYL